VVTVCVVAVLVVVEGVVVDDADGFQIVNLHVLLSLKKKKLIDIIYFSSQYILLEKPVASSPQY
jgi:hypothetical protein